MTEILEEAVKGKTSEEMKEQVERHVASLVLALVKRKVETDLNLATKKVAKMNILEAVSKATQWNSASGRSLQKLQQINPRASRRR